MKPYYQDEAVTIYHGDCGDILPELPKVDLVLTDPPYGLSFMGKDWDKAVPPMGIWQQSLGLLEPGSFAFVMSIPRQDCLARMIVNLQDAGFEMGFTPIYWAYATGFPKAQNIGKAVDKRNARTQETYKPFADYLKEKRTEKRLSMAEIDGKLGTNTAYSWWEGRLFGIQLPRKKYYLELKQILDLDNRFDELIEREEAEREVISRQPMTIGIGGNSPRMGSEKIVDIPATPQAKALDGSYGGFQPKPAVEVILVCMKPLSEKTFVDQALKNGKGITWLDDGRMPYESVGDKETHLYNMKGNERHRTPKQIFGSDISKDLSVNQTQGRFPANLLVSDDVLNDGRIRESGARKGANRINSMENSVSIGKGWQYTGGKCEASEGSFSRYFDLDRWFEEKLKELPESIQRTFPFLIVPKASKSEKNKGCEELPEKDIAYADYRQKYDTTKSWVSEYPDGQRRPMNKAKNTHPTVKPLKLMAYLIALGSREGDTVLDPFMGSGTSLLACQMMGRKAIGIEIEEKYCEIAANRCRQMVMGL